MYHVQPRTQTCLSAQAGSLQLQYALGECHGAGGKVEFIEDMEGKRHALDIIMRHYTKDQFSYSDPAVRNVKVWKVPVDQMTGKVFGLRADEKP